MRDIPHYCRSKRKHYMSTPFEGAWTCNPPRHQIGSLCRSALTAFFHSAIILKSDLSLADTILYMLRIVFRQFSQHVLYAQFQDIPAAIYQNNSAGRLLLLF